MSLKRVELGSLSRGRKDESGAPLRRHLGDAIARLSQVGVGLVTSFRTPSAFALPSLPAER